MVFSNGYARHDFTNLQHRLRTPLPSFPPTPKMRKATSFAAGLVAVLFAAVPLASAFTCTWRGGDYSWFTNNDDIPGWCCSPEGGTCPNGCGPSIYCNEILYESCYNCGTNAYCCEDLSPSSTRRPPRRSVASLSATLCRTPSTFSTRTKSNSRRPTATPR